MNSMVVGRYKSADVVHPRGGYQKSIAINLPNFFYHRDGHYVRPNMVAFKYPDFIKNVDPYVHVRVFNFAIKQMQRLLKSISSMCLVIP